MAPRAGARDGNPARGAAASPAGVRPRWLGRAGAASRAGSRRAWRRPALAAGVPAPAGPPRPRPADLSSRIPGVRPRWGRPGRCRPWRSIAASAAVRQAAGPPCPSPVGGARPLSRPGGGVSRGETAHGHDRPGGTGPAPGTGIRSCRLSAASASCLRLCRVSHRPADPPGRRVPAPGPAGVGPARAASLAGHGRVCCRPAGGRAAVSVTGRGRAAAESPRRGRLAG